MADSISDVYQRRIFESKYLCLEGTGSPNVLVIYLEKEWVSDKDENDRK